jgi:molybdopterin molybdotransferase
MENSYHPHDIFNGILSMLVEKGLLPEVPAEEMLTVADALARILAHFDRLPAERIPTSDALSRVLAEDARAQHDVPPFANSAMDGYAVRAADVQIAAPEQPVELRTIEDIPAGATPSQTVQPGTTARIMTGAPLPPGADAIIPVEDTDEPWQEAGRDKLPPPERVKVFASTSPNRHVRPAGQDIAAGDVSLKKGAFLRPQELGVLAALGAAEIAVVQQPNVAILSTGDELLSIEAQIQPGKIRDVNGYTLSNLARQYGGLPLWLGIVPDNPEAVRESLQSAIDQGAHLILSSAGVSVGAFDVVRDVLNEFGQIDFWRVRMRPGKPLAFGLVGNVPFLGLPGNPVSAMVSFDVFARPAILKMGGRAWQTQTVPVTLADTFRSDGRESYLRVEVTQRDGQWVAKSVGSQASNLLTSMVRANALLILPEGTQEARTGETYQARFFDTYSPFLNHHTANEQRGP